MPRIGSPVTSPATLMMHSESSAGFAVKWLGESPKVKNIFSAD